ncbi:acylglycerol kinase, mitochondrial [Ambystoma mexicanum]|uniref:acylglycerol kinase, mitochondrial n=1 Tax=Ambystoma mexicanum TaxID=8296 RepID=UPI0037E7C307
MARVVRIFRTLRNNWKKSTVGFCLLTYGGHWLYGKYCDNMLRRAACQEAQVFGNQLIPPNVHVQKATVFLNPAAYKGKARNLFEKNAAPILHLAGLDVTIVKTDYEGQAKKLLELLESTDLIIVAGGDGTLQEVVTGLLRRADQAVFSRIPIGFIPLGATSTLSHTLYPQSENKVKQISDATLAILKGETVALDVLEIKGESSPPVYAMTGLKWGSYRDAAEKASKYWYLGPLKSKASHLFSTWMEWPQKHPSSIKYLGPTERLPDEPEVRPSRPSLYSRICKRLSHYWYPPKEEGPAEIVPEPWEEAQLSPIELSITTQNQHLNLLRTEDSMTICIEPETISKGEFITVGSQRIGDPHLCSEGSRIVQASQCILLLPEGTEGFFSIDAEEYDAMSVEVRLLPRKLRFLCDPSRKQNLLQRNQTSSE